VFFTNDVADALKKAIRFKNVTGQEGITPFVMTKEGINISCGRHGYSHGVRRGEKTFLLC
jgi:hypothetical protein